MAVRNCKEIGENLQKIMVRLMANDDLVKLLYYNDADPLSHDALTTEQKQEKVFNKLIKIIPKITTHETTQSVVTIRVANGVKASGNNEFRTIQINIEVFVPWDQWLYKSTNLRPFAILGLIQESLEDKTINGLGKIYGGNFTLSFLTDELACYEATYNIITYD